MTDQLLVIDVGTSGVRAAVVDGDGRVGHLHHESVLPSSPMPGFVEFDAAAMAQAVLAAAHEAAEAAGAVTAVGITNQRASTIVWDRATGEPVGPGVGWQDLRTVATCLMLQAQGIRVAPNVSATKLAFLLDMADADRTRDLCFGTVDSWVAWTLSGGAAHVIDATNAGVTGLVNSDVTDWDDAILDALRIPRSVLPTIVDSSGACRHGVRAPRRAADRRHRRRSAGVARRPGVREARHGEDHVRHRRDARPRHRRHRPTAAQRSDAGCFPIVAWRRNGYTAWGLEAAMLSAGTCIEWLRDDLGLIKDAAESDTLAASVDDSGDVWFVPALLGLGAPYWDFGARGTLVGLTRGTTRAHVVRAVLEGVAHRGADLVAAAEADSKAPIESIRVDGGMSANATFVQALADACGRPVEISPEREATTLGAAYLAGLAVGTWKDEAEIAAALVTRACGGAEQEEPAPRPLGRSRQARRQWHCARAQRAGLLIRTGAFFGPVRARFTSQFAVFRSGAADELDFDVEVLDARAGKDAFEGGDVGVVAAAGDDDVALADGRERRRVVRPPVAGPRLDPRMALALDRLAERGVGPVVHVARHVAGGDVHVAQQSERHVHEVLAHAGLLAPRVDRRSAHASGAGNVLEPVVGNGDRLHRRLVDGAATADVVDDAHHLLVDQRELRRREEIGVLVGEVGIRQRIPVDRRSAVVAHRR